MGRGAWAGSWLCVALVLACAVARGQDRERDGEARRAFDRGVAALDENRLADARMAFEECLRLRPVPVVRYNLGLVYRGLGMVRAAIAAFEDYLREPERGAEPSRLGALRSELAQLRRRLVRLRLVLHPADAEVAVDGHLEAPERGVLVLDPGLRVVEVRAPGRRSQRRELRLVAGERRDLEVDLELAASRGRLVVEPSDARAAVFVDGARVGSGALEHAVDAGEHAVEVRLAGYETFERTVAVRAGDTVRLDATMVPAGRSGARWVLPALVAGGAVAAGALVVFLVFQARGRDAPYESSWGNFAEPVRIAW